MLSKTSLIGVSSETEASITEHCVQYKAKVSGKNHIILDRNL